jgi:predicted transcriptional regulator
VLNSDRIAVMVEIVRFCELSRDMVQIMNKMSLNNIYAEAYLAILTQQKLLLHEDGKYETTDRGRQFLSTYDQLEKIIVIPASPVKEMRVFLSSSASQTPDLVSRL